MRRVFSFVEARKIWLLSFLGAGIICFYGYYWFVVLQQQDDAVKFSEIYEEQSISIENEDVDFFIADATDAVPVENTSYEESFDEQIANHLSTKIDISRQPSILNVIHISRLMELEKDSYDNHKKADVSNAISHEIQIPRIAIVIDDMGASPIRTNEIITLKAPLTASFVTFAPQLDKQVHLSREAGHEIMVHVPMQPHSDIFVSDDVLTVKMSSEEIEQRFREMLAKFDDVVGINNHMGSEFTEYADKLAPIMKVLAEQNLFFLDSKTTPKSQGEEIAKQYAVPCVHRHVFLDNENNQEYIIGQLEKAEKIASKNGYAIAIGHPKSQTSKALAVWLNTLKEKHIQLVPLSEIVTTISRPKEEEIK